MASTAPLRPRPPPLLTGLQRPPIKSTFLIPFRVRKNINPHPNSDPSFSPKFPISASLDPSPSSSWEREEIRWMREEQRWIREESRWKSERESLLYEIASLRLGIEALERDRSSISESIGSLGRTAAAEAQPMLVGQADVKMVLEEVRVSEDATERTDEREKNKKKERVALRKGSEGKDVRAMQEALLRLGFYSGEEDMEYSSFSSGTELAVKTWQASLGTLEDGIMTSEFLERLFMERSLKEYANPGGDSVSTAGKDGTNGAAIASVTEIAEIQQTVIKESGDAEVEVSKHRVFLLGENRWEEPSRLVGRDKPIGGSKFVSPTKCLTCRGEGQLLCTECDGSGEPNIEPQFLEWFNEGAKCPYCEGLGYTVCDVCKGKTTTAET